MWTVRTLLIQDDGTCRESFRRSIMAIAWPLALPPATSGVFLAAISGVQTVLADDDWLANRLPANCDWLSVVAILDSLTRLSMREMFLSARCRRQALCSIFAATSCFLRITVDEQTLEQHVTLTRIEVIFTCGYRLLYNNSTSKNKHA